MTTLSRTDVRGGVNPAGTRRLSRILRGWHAACCTVLASGCFYIGPMPTLEENVPPVPFRYTIAPNEPVGIGAAGTTVMVLATDEDDDPIYFTWWLSADGYIGYATPVPYDNGAGSQVRLSHDLLLDGQMLNCEIEDGVNAPVQLSWPLEVYP